MAYSIALAKIDGVEQVILSTTRPSMRRLARNMALDSLSRPRSYLWTRRRTMTLCRMRWRGLIKMQLVLHYCSFTSHDAAKRWSVVERAMSPIGEIRCNCTAIRCRPSLLSSGLCVRDGYLMSLTTDDTDIEKFNGPRQSFPDVLIPNGTWTLHEVPLSEIKSVCMERAS